MHIAISDETESESIEFNPNITAELNEKRELIGIEMLNASTFIRDTTVEKELDEFIQLQQITVQKKSSIPRSFV